MHSLQKKNNNNNNNNWTSLFIYLPHKSIIKILELFFLRTFFVLVFLYIPKKIKIKLMLEIGGLKLANNKKSWFRFWMPFAHLLRLFSDIQCILKGRTVHGKIITSGFRPDAYVNNHLMSLYRKSNRINDAHKVFDTMPKRNLDEALINKHNRDGQ